MLRKKIFIGLIILLFFSCSTVSAFDLFGDGLEPENIYIDEFDTSITNFIYDSNGDSDNDYMYSVDYTLCNFSTSLKGSTVVTYLYNNDTVLYFNYTLPLEDENTEYYTDEDGIEYTTSPDDDSFPSNQTSDYIDDVTGDYNKVIISSAYFPEKIINVTHVKIEVIKDGEVVFNATHPFNMSHYEEERIDDTTSSSDETDDSTSNYEATYVASADSDKFHEPSCTQAQRIKDENKITFSSRDEAIDAGYSPCGICYP